MVMRWKVIVVTVMVMVMRTNDGDLEEVDELGDEKQGQAEMSAM